MDALTILGIILGVVAFTIMIFFNIRANQIAVKEFEKEPEKRKSWGPSSTITALYLAKYGINSLGNFSVLAMKIKRTESSLLVKVKIFKDLFAGNVTKNATKLDREVFSKYSDLPEKIIRSRTRNFGGIL